MKRFHIHVSVADLEPSIHFYSTLFGAAPAVVKSDYAKWMVDDPRINFAISTRSSRVGINHLGVQTDSDAELEALSEQLRQADVATAQEKNTACCYARSNKYWVQDPSGIAWETFHSLGTIPTFGEERVSEIAAATETSSASSGALASSPQAVTAACCGEAAKDVGNAAQRLPAAAGACCS